MSKNKNKQKNNSNNSKSPQLGSVKATESTPLKPSKSDSENQTKLQAPPADETVISDNSEEPKNYDATTGKPIEAPAPESTFRDHKLEMKSMTRKERRAEKKRIYREYTSEMTGLQSLTYFFDYYKWYILGPLCAILIIGYIGVTIYKNSQPVALSYVILNSDNTEEINLDFEAEYSTRFNLSDKYRFKRSLGMNIDYDYYKEHEESIQTNNGTDYYILSTQCSLNDYDVIISNSTGVQYCSSEGVAYKLKGFFDSEEYEKLEPYMSEFENAYGHSENFAIDISETDFAKGLNLEYDDVYIVFPSAESSNKQNAMRLLEMILQIE